MSYDMSKVLFSPLFSTYISERIKMIFFCKIRLDLKFWLDLSQQPLLLSVTMRDKPDFPVVPRQIRLAKKYTLLQITPSKHLVLLVTALLTEDHEGQIAGPNSSLNKPKNQDNNALGAVHILCQPKQGVRARQPFCTTIFNVDFL